MSSLLCFPTWYWLVLYKMGYFMKRHPPLSAAEIRQQWKHLSCSQRTGIFHVNVDRLFERDPWIALGLLFYLNIAGFQGSEFRWCLMYIYHSKEESFQDVSSEQKLVFKPWNISDIVPWLISPQTGADFLFEIEELIKYLLFFRKVWLVEVDIRAGYAEMLMESYKFWVISLRHEVKVQSWLCWFSIPISKAGEPCWPHICRRATRINRLMSSKFCSTLSRLNFS